MIWRMCLRFRLEVKTWPRSHKAELWPSAWSRCHCGVTRWEKLHFVFCDQEWPSVIMSDREWLLWQTYRCYLSFLGSLYHINKIRTWGWRPGPRERIQWSNLVLSSSSGCSLTSGDLQVLEPGQGSCDLSGSVDQDSYTIKAFIFSFSRNTMTTC